MKKHKHKNIKLNLAKKNTKLIKKIAFFKISCLVPTMCRPFQDAQIISPSNDNTFKGDCPVGCSSSSVISSWKVYKNTGDWANRVWTGLTTEEQKSIISIIKFLIHGGNCFAK